MIGDRDRIVFAVSENFNARHGDVWSHGLATRQGSMISTAPIIVDAPTWDKRLYSSTTCQWPVVLAAPITLNVPAGDERPQSLTTCRKSVVLVAPKIMNVPIGYVLFDPSWNKTFELNRVTAWIVVHDGNLRQVVLIFLIYLSHPRLSA